MKPPLESHHSKAPALDRGLQLIYLLQTHEALSLEEASNLCKAPKSSLIRVFETLEAWSLVKRDVVTKRYSLYLPMNLADGEKERWQGFVGQSLREFSLLTGLTSEWYLPRVHHVELVDRHEPSHTAVSIRAKVGFTRPAWGQWEAVNKLALKYQAIQAQNHEQNDDWIYDNGEERPIGPEEKMKILNDIPEEGLVFDREYNPYGVRRVAKAVFSEGRLFGILAMPQHYHPKADEQMLELCSQMRSFGSRFETQLRQYSKPEALI